MKRLQRSIRSGATYDRSMSVLRWASEHSDIKVKSGIMLGLGETEEEGSRNDTRSTHKRGSVANHWSIYVAYKRSCANASICRTKRVVELEDFAYELGFDAVASGPLVRSSYRADLMVRT